MGDRLAGLRYKSQLKMDKLWIKIVISFLLEILIAVFLYYLSYAVYYYCASQTMLNMWANYKKTFSASDITNQQLSLGFIVLGFTAILSSDTKIYYWTNSIDFKLKKPICVGFVGYTTRLLANIGISFILIGLNDNYIYINYVVFLITLSLFLYRLIDVNFEKERNKTDIEKYYRWIKDNNEEEKNKINGSLKEITSRYISLMDIQGYQDNIKFMIENEECGLLFDILMVAKVKSSLFIEQFLEIIKGVEMSDEDKYRRITDTLKSAGMLDKLQSADMDPGLKQKLRKL